VIALTSLGVDASNVYSGIEGLYWNFVEKLTESMPTVVNEVIFCLTALDSGEYGTQANRDDCINILLNGQIQHDIGQIRWSWGLGNADWDVDITAMAIAALAPYYSDAGVKAAVEGALAFLSARQMSDGHLGDANSTAMTIVALAALGIDPIDDSRFISSNGNDLIGGLLTFRTGTDRFGYDNNTTDNTLATEQGFRALVAYQGFVGESGTYNIYRFGPQTGDGTALTGESDPTVNPPDPNAPKNVTVRVVDLCNGSTIIPETPVSLSGAHLDALLEALRVNGHDPDVDAAVSYGYVSSILGFSTGADTGWMFAVNGEIPVVGLDEIPLVNGDSLVLFFINWWDSVYLSKFNQRAATITAGGSITLTLTGIDSWAAMGSGGEYTPISGATVYAVDAAGNQVSGISAVTGLTGSVTLVFPSSGTYIVTAVKAGAANAWEIVPPLCTVTVTQTGGTPSGNDNTIRFTLQGLNPNTLAEQMWINNVSVTVPVGATVAEAIMTALAESGYTQEGAQAGYVRSVTTPGGFRLAEMHSRDWPNSGWLFKINGTLHKTGIDSITVKNNDSVLLYFTKDFNEDPDAGSFLSDGSFSGSSVKVEDEETAVISGMRVPLGAFENWENLFDDVSESDWFYDAIRFVNTLGLMSGTAGDTFAPDLNLSRAMLITILARMAGVDTTVGETWYSEAVAWGVENGITDGTNLSDYITREQLVTMLFRFAELLGLDTSERADISRFDDADDVSDWARDAMAWAIAAALIQGRTETTIVPGGTASRAEAATILTRFINAYELLETDTGSDTEDEE